MMKEMGLDPDEFI